MLEQAKALPRPEADEIRRRTAAARETLATQQLLL